MYYPMYSKHVAITSGCLPPQVVVTYYSSGVVEYSDIGKYEVRTASMLPAYIHTANSPSTII